MATFAQASFNAGAYLACRPSYPISLVESILAYAKPASQPSPRIALDLGCGPGQLTNLLAETGAFDRVIGTDPSSGMVDKAKAMAAEKQAKVEFAVASAEKLDDFADGEVSLVTSAQAAHWFDHPKVYRELARVLRPGGVIAHVGYGEFYMPEHPKISDVIAKYFREKLGPYWERPGRTKAEYEYDPIPFPADELTAFDRSSFRRIKYNLESSPAYRPPPVTPGVYVDERRPPTLIRHWSRAELLAYLNTASSVHTYTAQHPGTDVAGDFVGEIAHLVGGEWAQGQEGAKETVIWPLALLLMRKKT